MTLTVSTVHGGIGWLRLTGRRRYTVPPSDSFVPWKVNFLRNAALKPQVRFFGDLGRENCAR